MNKYYFPLTYNITSKNIKNVNAVSGRDWFKDRISANTKFFVHEVKKKKE